MRIDGVDGDSHTHLLVPAAVAASRHDTSAPPPPC